MDLAPAKPQSTQHLLFCWGLLLEQFFILPCVPKKNVFSNCGSLILNMSIRSCLLNVRLELPESADFCLSDSSLIECILKSPCDGGFVPLSWLSLMMFLSESLTLSDNYKSQAFFLKIY